MPQLIKAPVMLPDARDAIDVLSAFEASTEGFYAYEVSPVFNGERQLVGYHVRVKDLDGFGLGYLA